MEVNNIHAICEKGVVSVSLVTDIPAPFSYNKEEFLILRFEIKEEDFFGYIKENFRNVTVRYFMIDKIFSPSIKVIKIGDNGDIVNFIEERKYELRVS